MLQPPHSHRATSQNEMKSLSATQAQHQVECRLLLDVVVSQGAAILQLLAGKDQTLLVRGDACKDTAQRKTTADQLA